MTRPTRTFDPASVDGLPEVARRFFLHAIDPGAPLARMCDLRMRGEIRIRQEGKALPFTASQLLAPPHGFVWSARAGRGLLRISGFDRYEDGEGEMRWRLWGLIPVASARGRDVTRSAAGRLAMESVLLPPSLLPGSGIIWEGLDEGNARYTLRIGDESVESTLTVDPQGRPLRMGARRWSERAGPGYDLFVVEFAGELEADGIRIPREITAGWRLGADDEFRFYRATLDEARFQ